jgi:tetratricopeptide (TPR) repeat protein
MDNPQAHWRILRRVQLSSDPYLQADAYAYQASVHYESLGDLPKAIDNLQKAYELNDWHGYLENAAKYAVQAEEYDQAINLYNRLLADQRGDPRLLAGRAYVEWRMGDAESRAVRRARAAMQPDLLEAHYLKGLLLLTPGTAGSAG